LKLKLLVLVLRPALAPTFTEDLSLETVAFPMVTSPDEFDCPGCDSAWLGLTQILIWPSRQIVTTDSFVKTKPERGSTWTRCATTGESFGTSRMLGAGKRVPFGVMLSQCADGDLLLKVGDPPEGWRNGTAISSMAKSHRRSCVS
jgi:hypothetical protein